MVQTLRVPYTQQFTPDQTPLRKLIDVVRQHQGDRNRLRTAIGAAFFKAKASPGKLAGNTLIALKTYDIIDGSGKLTAFGHSLASAATETDAHRLLAEQILLRLDGIAIVETLREMKSAGQKIQLSSLPSELRKRGFAATDSSSDLSGLFNWLRAAGVLGANYSINDDAYAAIVGAEPAQMAALKGLTPEQIYFLRALIALGVTDFTPYNTVVRHAEGLYTGQVRYNWKDIDRTVLKPLQAAGLIDIRRMKKSAPGARGGKAAEVRPTSRLDSQVADALLSSLAKSAGYADYREIASKSWADIVAAVQQTKDRDARARGLELLTIKIALTLDLDFMGWRTTDEALAAGGEIDAMLHSARLVYSRWQVQCKAAAHITLEAVAKEVGLADVSHANVILIASTGTATKSADIFRRQIVKTKNLNIVFLEGRHLEQIVKDPAAIVQILNEQAREALSLKGRPEGLRGTPPPSTSE
jgi:site-specific DNA-methyltransferase (cytosine-N4-specific)